MDVKGAIGIVASAITIAVGAGVQEVQSWTPLMSVMRRNGVRSRGKKKNNNNNNNKSSIDQSSYHEYYDDYDMVVIGAGASGMFAAGTASSFGCKTLLIEKHDFSFETKGGAQGGRVGGGGEEGAKEYCSKEEDEDQQFFIGGDCTNSACVPSKAIRCAAQVAKLSSKFSSQANSNSKSQQSLYTYSAAAARKHAGDTTQKVRDRETPKRVASSPNLDIIFASSVSFEGPNELVLGGSSYLFNGTFSGFLLSSSTCNSTNNAEIRVTGKKFVICTGAGPVIPKSIQKSADDVGLQILTYRSILRPDGVGVQSEQILWKEENGDDDYYYYYDDHNRDNDNYGDDKDVERSERTKSIVIVGGGPTACELAQSLARLKLNLNGNGHYQHQRQRQQYVNISMVAPSVLGTEDIGARRFARKMLNEDGVTIMQGRRAVKIERGFGGQHEHENRHACEHERKDPVVLVLDDETRLPVDVLICAMGRKPNLDELQLEKAGVEWSPEEGVIVNSKLQSVSCKHVFAAGDCASAIPTRDRRAAHAGWTGYHAIQSAIFPRFLLPSDSVHPVVPRVTFMDPEIASIGLTRAECVQKFGDGGFKYVKVAEDGTDRADIDSFYRSVDGFVELRVSIPKGEILGATICSPAASEIINEIGLAMVNKLTCRDIAKSIHAYPSYGYLMHRAALSLAMSDVWGLLAACGPIGRVAGSIGRNIQGGVQQRLLKKKKNENVRQWEYIGAAKEVDFDLLTTEKDLQSMVGLSFLEASKDEGLCEAVRRSVKVDVSNKDEIIDFIKWLKSKPA